MSEEEALLVNAAKVGVGTAIGVVSGLRNASAPHVNGIGTGLVNGLSKFSNGATKAIRNHRGAAGAISAGTAAVVGHGAVAAAVVAAAPAVVATAVVGGALFGIYKAIKYVRDEF
jgi:hypothetical protein